jgi:hypothetical protein
VVVGDGSSTTVVVVAGDVEVAVWRLEVRTPDLSVVDAAARLHVAARRLGWSISVRDPGEELCRLLDLVGLADVVGAPCRSPLEARREAEGSEQLGVEEVVPPRDPCP